MSHPPYTNNTVNPKILCGVEKEPKQFGFWNKIYIEEDEVPVRMMEGQELRTSPVLLKQ